MSGSVHAAGLVGEVKSRVVWRLVEESFLLLLLRLGFLLVL